MSKNTIALAILILVMAGGVALGVYLKMDATQGSADLQSLRLLPTPRQLTDFHLEDADGQRFDREDLKAEGWSVLFYGFTSCPDICPATLATLAASNGLLTDQGIKPPQVVFVSVDPERDRGEPMRRYATHFNPDFVSITGEHPQLQAFALQTAAMYVINEPEVEGGYYSVDHSASLALIDDQARLVGLFAAPHDPATIADDLAKVLPGA